MEFSASMLTKATDLKMLQTYKVQQMDYSSLLRERAMKKVWVGSEADVSVIESLRTTNSMLKSMEPSLPEDIIKNQKQLEEQIIETEQLAEESAVVKQQFLKEAPDVFKDGLNDVEMVSLAFENYVRKLEIPDTLNICAGLRQCCSFYTSRILVKSQTHLAMERAQKQLDDQVVIYKNETAVAHKSRVEAEQKCATLTKRNIDLEKYMQNYLFSNEKLKKENVQFAESVSQLRTEVKQSEIRTAVAEAGQQDAKERLSRITNALTEARNKNKDLEAINADIKSQLEQYRLVQKGDTETIMSIVDKNKLLMYQNGELNTEVELLKSSLERYNLDMKKLQERSKANEVRQDEVNSMMAQLIQVERGHELVTRFKIDDHELDVLKDLSDKIFFFLKTPNARYIQNKRGRDEIIQTDRIIVVEDNKNELDSKMDISDPDTVGGGDADAMELKLRARLKKNMKVVLARSEISIQTNNDPLTAIFGTEKNQMNLTKLQDLGSKHPKIQNIFETLLLYKQLVSFLDPEHQQQQITRMSYHLANPMLASMKSVFNKLINLYLKSKLDADMLLVRFDAILNELDVVNDYDDSVQLIINALVNEEHAKGIKIPIIELNNLRHVPEALRTSKQQLQKQDSFKTTGQKESGRSFQKAPQLISNKNSVAIDIGQFQQPEVNQQQQIKIALPQNSGHKKDLLLSSGKNVITNSMKRVSQVQRPSVSLRESLKPVPQILKGSDKFLQLMNEKIRGSTSISSNDETYEEEAEEEELVAEKEIQTEIQQPQLTKSKNSFDELKQDEEIIRMINAAQMELNSLQSKNIRSKQVIQKDHMTQTDLEQAQCDMEVQTDPVREQVVLPDIFSQNCQELMKDPATFDAERFVDNIDYQPKVIESMYFTKVEETTDEKVLETTRKTEEIIQKVIKKQQEPNQQELLVTELKTKPREKKQIDQKLKTVEIKPSYIERHPRAGSSLDAGSTLSQVPERQRFYVFHERDRTFLLYQPDQNKQSVVSPAILKEFDAKLAKGLMKSTFQQFQAAFFNEPAPNDDKTLIPRPGERISRVRCSALAKKEPNLYKLMLKEFGDMPRFVQFSGSRYLEIPYTNVNLRSKQWIKAQIEEIMAARLKETCTILYQKDSITELNKLSVPRYIQLTGSLKRQEYESLAAYSVYHIVNKFGDKSIGAQMIFNLIANLAYYQYFDQELYVFARFFFDDLENDYFLLYCDMMKILQLSGNDDDEDKMIEIESLPKLVHELFQGATDDQRTQLILQIHQFIHLRAEAAGLQVQSFINFADLASVILFFYGVVRRQVWGYAQILFGHVLQQQRMDTRMTRPRIQTRTSLDTESPNDTGRKGMDVADNSLGAASFSVLVQSLVPEWDAQTAAEMFFAFQVGGVGLVQFDEMFRSMQLPRFVKVNTDLLKTNVGAEVKTRAASAAELFRMLGPVVARVRQIFELRQLRTEVLQLNQLMAGIQQDLLVYDSQQAITKIFQIIDLVARGTLKKFEPVIAATAAGAIVGMAQFVGQPE